tara:strand:- start:1899 stop:2078 length:180 start_codon:yes stop_codon:yes gene_type:complete
MYKKIKVAGTDTIDEDIILKYKDKDGNEIPYKWIPKDPANSDYYDYLEWAKTNTIEEAD